jgi:hypothetical protein
VKITMNSLTKALKPLLVSERIVTLRCLKEAAIIDQNFAAAAALRDAEKKLTGGKSGINVSRPRGSKKALRSSPSALRSKSR